ncbi:MAG: single-stranded-DNA-specific exonuclease RecJ [Patescibacteria group bacterium]|nr:single-stranded-DNA-specific exonuclease RecJ [Patescibacteria group bacterium]
MQNKWQLKPAVSADLVKQFPEYNKIILQLLANRNLIEKQAIETFFLPVESKLLDPFLFKDMRAAVELTIQHIKAGDLIAVYGDYDADGVTSAALVTEILKILKAKTAVYIPARITEGYGLNKKAIDELKKNGAKLIITVDNGIRNKSEVEYARGLGLDVIISDHHEVPAKREDWPDCLIINPKADSYPYKFLAGVGVAFKFARALIETAKLDVNTKTKLEEKILDLVAVGTVADMVSLIGENRALVGRGLKVVNQRKRLGLKELIDISQINGAKEIKAWNIGWQIGPRLNSAGRMDHANTAYELLITKDKAEAVQIAQSLNEKNQARQKITEEIFAAAKKMVEEKMLADKILVVACPSSVGGSGVWPEGVMGLVAGRLCEAYARPALVITEHQGEIKGSGRSVDELNIIKAVEKLSEHLKRFGGHAAACGFTVKSREDLAAFTEKIKALAATALAGVELAPKILVEAEIDLADINDEFVEILEKFEPCGEENERPKFLSRGLTIMDKMTMGADARHVKFRFGSLWAVGFGQAANCQNFKIGDRVDVVYYLEFNEFNGRRTAQMKIVDIKKT